MFLCWRPWKSRLGLLMCQFLLSRLKEVLLLSSLRLSKSLPAAILPFLSLLLLTSDNSSRDGQRCYATKLPNVKNGFRWSLAPLTSCLSDDESKSNLERMLSLKSWRMMGVVAMSVMTSMQLWSELSRSAQAFDFGACLWLCTIAVRPHVFRFLSLSFFIRISCIH